MKKLYPFDTVEFFYTKSSFRVPRGGSKGYYPAHPIDLEKDSSKIEDSLTYGDVTPEVIEEIPNKFTEFEYVSGFTGNYNHNHIVVLTVKGERMGIEVDDSSFCDIVKNCSSDKGIFKGEFRFINEKGTKLVRVGSKREVLYAKKNSEKSLTTHKVKRISSLKDFVVGKIYFTEGEMKGRISKSRLDLDSLSRYEFKVYLGEVYTPDLKNLKPKKKRLFLNVCGWFRKDKDRESLYDSMMSHSYYTYFSNSTTNLYSMITTSVEEDFVKDIKSKGLFSHLRKSEYSSRDPSSKLGDFYGQAYYNKDRKEVIKYIKELEEEKSNMKWETVKTHWGRTYYNSSPIGVRKLKSSDISTFF